MVSGCVSWNEATKSFFVNDKRLKVNSKTYKRHLEKEFLRNIESIMKRNIEFSFKVVHRHITQMWFKIS